jgi:FMN phosphatase YigB (HAD superfamily)
MKSVIFDLDDTLYVSKELRAKRERALLRFLKERSDKYVELRKSNNTISALEKMGVSKEKFFEIMESVPIRLGKDKKLRKVLTALKKEFRLVVLSNSSSLCVVETLRELGILDLIDEYYGGDCFSKTKPAEEAFSVVKKGDICVGNNFRKDLMVPKQKGAVTVLVGDEKAEADIIIQNIYELAYAISNKYLNK